MKLNRTNKKIISLLFSILMITSVFAGFVMPVMAIGTLFFENFEGYAENSYPVSFNHQ